MTIEIISVHKLDHNGRKVWTYPAAVAGRSHNRIILEAVFDRSPVQIGRITINRGDLFREYFYTDRWYNIFQISEPLSGQLKGWYCNITRPAVVDWDGVKAEDLALDLVLYPDGEYDLLDEDEYEGLGLGADERKQVELALRELLQLAAERKPPFSKA